MTERFVDSMLSRIHAASCAGREARITAHGSQRSDLHRRQRPQRTNQSLNSATPKAQPLAAASLTQRRKRAHVHYEYTCTMRMSTRGARARVCPRFARHASPPGKACIRSERTSKPFQTPSWCTSHPLMRTLHTCRPFGWHEMAGAAGSGIAKHKRPTGITA